MERLTVRKGDIVYYVKDNDMIAPVNMSGFDVKQALSRLAELEDLAEPAEPEIVTMQNVEYRKCPVCGKTLFYDKYCPNCGRAVKV